MKSHTPYTMLGSPHKSGMAGRSRVSRLLGRRLTSLIVLVILGFGLILLVFNIYQLRLMQREHEAFHGASPVVEASVSRDTDKQPIVWVRGKKVNSGYLKHVFNVFDRLGYIRGDEHSDWDVLWSHDYPFVSLKETMMHLKPHQRVNHFPGSGFITNKVSLVTSGVDTKYIPRAFKIPKQKAEFLDYVSSHPETSWVQKSNNHRGVVIIPHTEVDLKKENSFVQEYVGNPYLINNRRFDLGIYTAVTSIDPLRIYIQDGEWLVRFCPEEYYPFDPKVKDKYVISDDYMPPWQVPSIAKFYNSMDFTRKESLFAHLRSDGRDPEKLAETIRDAIRSVYLKMESKLAASASNYPHPRAFFELVRFDFVLDEELNVYLLEVNLSPNLSSGHFAGNKLMYEQVVYGLLNLVGVARSQSADWSRGTEDEQNMEVASRNIQTYSTQCASHQCRQSCSKLECRLCNVCMRPAQISILRSAYREHMNRKTWRRVFPTPFQHREAAAAMPMEDDAFSSLSPADQLMTLWFRGKCLQDAGWCW